MLGSWRHNFARRGDLVVGLLVGVVLTALFVTLGTWQISGVPMENYHVVDWNSLKSMDVSLTASESELASASVASRVITFSSPGGDMVDVHELSPALRRICERESKRPRPENFEEQSEHVSLRAGWPLQIELLGGRTKEWPWEIRPSWLGVTLINDGQTVGTMPYRPAILSVLANILLYALPIALMLGLIRTQIALIRAARGNCTACGYPRPSTTCPECGQEH